MPQPMQNFVLGADECFETKANGAAAHACLVVCGNKPYEAL